MNGPLLTPEDEVSLFSENLAPLEFIAGQITAEPNEHDEAAVALARGVMAMVENFRAMNRRVGEWMVGQDHIHEMIRQSGGR